MKSKRYKIFLKVLSCISIFALGFILTADILNLETKDTTDVVALNNKVNIAEEKQFNIIESQEISNILLNSEVKEEVEKIHVVLNNTVGWGRTPVNTDYYELQKILNKIDKITKQTTYEPLIEDLTKLYSYLKSGIVSRDIDYIISSHRIIHDLDYHFFNNKEDVKYGVTKTVENIEGTDINIKTK